MCVNLLVSDRGPFFAFMNDEVIGEAGRRVTIVEKAFFLAAAMWCHRSDARS